MIRTVANFILRHAMILAGVICIALVFSRSDFQTTVTMASVFYLGVVLITHGVFAIIDAAWRK